MTADSRSLLGAAPGLGNRGSRVQADRCAVTLVLVVAYTFRYSTINKVVYRDVSRIRKPAEPPGFYYLELHPRREVRLRCNVCNPRVEDRPTG